VKVVNTPEVLRVFVGSMRSEPYSTRTDVTNHLLFDRERESLLSDLRGLPRDTRIRRINETVKRWRAVKTHAVLCSHLSDQFGWVGKSDKQAELLKSLELIYADLARRHGLNVADFPDPANFRRTVTDLDIEMWKWSATTETSLAAMDKAVSDDIRPLLALAYESPDVPESAELAALNGDEGRDR